MRITIDPHSLRAIAGEIDHVEAEANAIASRISGRPLPQMPPAEAMVTRSQFDQVAVRFLGRKKDWVLK